MTATDPASSEAVHRLAHEFGGLLSRRTVTDVVRWSARDLDTCPAPARAELLERLARQRLLDHFPGPLAAPARL